MRVNLKRGVLSPGGVKWGHFTWPQEGGCLEQDRMEPWHTEGACRQGTEGSEITVCAQG